MSVLYVEHHPRPGAPALVLLHGWGLHSGVWSSWLEALSRHFDLTLIDLPGMGRSADAQLNPYTLSALADRLASVHNTPAIWVGWSLGGLAAMAVARRHPDRVQGLVTLATNPCFVQREDWPHAMDPATFARFDDELAVDWVQTLNRFALLQGQGDTQARTVVRELKQALALYREHPPTQLAPALALLDTDYRAQFAALTLPRLHLFGEADQLVPAQVAAQKPLAPYARVIPGAGHVPFLSAPESVLAALLDFSREVAPGD